MLLQLSLCLALSSAGAPQAAEPSVNPIFPEDARLELVFKRSAKLNSGLTEGPAVAPDGSVHFTDMPFGSRDQTMIHRYDPKTGKVELFTAEGGKANGLAFDAAGNLLACDGADGGGRCVARWNVKTGTRVTVADRYQCKRLNAPNDLCVDRRGRIYFTDPRYVGDEPRELEHRAVYRIEPDGKVIEVTHDVEMPNGIVLGPDERTLYVGDHNNGGNRQPSDDKAPARGAMRLYAFPLDDAGMPKGQRRTLIDFGEENGCDGITVDAEGHIYVACRSLARPGVLVIDADGERLAFLPTGPSHQSGEFEAWQGIPSNVEFGSDEPGAYLYVTIDKALYRIATKQCGTPPLWRAERREEPK